MDGSDVVQPRRGQKVLGKANGLRLVAAVDIQLKGQDVRGRDAELLRQLAQKPAVGGVVVHKLGGIQRQILAFGILAYLLYCGSKKRIFMIIIIDLI